MEFFGSIGGLEDERKNINLKHLNNGNGEGAFASRVSPLSEAQKQAYSYLRNSDGAAAAKMNPLTGMRLPLELKTRSLSSADDAYISVRRRNSALPTSTKSSTSVQGQNQLCKEIIDLDLLSFAQTNCKFNCEGDAGKKKNLSDKTRCKTPWSSFGNARVNEMEAMRARMRPVNPLATMFDRQSTRTPTPTPSSTPLSTA